MSGDFKLDFERRARIGLDEALFCESKTVDQISAIVDAVKAKTGRMLLTRLDQSKHEALLARHGASLEFDSLSRTAILGKPHRALRTATVAIVMAGTSDLPAGREAARTLAFAGQPYREYTDVGVAASGACSNGSRRSDPLLSSSWPRAWTRRWSASSAAWSQARSSRCRHRSATASRAAAKPLCTRRSRVARPEYTAVNIDNGYGAACAALRVIRVMALQASGDRTPHEAATHVT